MRACASFGVSLVVRLGAMSVAFEGGIVSAGGLQYRQLPPAARPSARPTAVDALMDALDEQYEEDKSFTEMFDPAQSKVQCAFAFEVAARSVQTGRSDKGCRVQSSSKKKNPVKCTHTVDGLCIRFGRAKVEAALRASPAGQQMRGSSMCCRRCYDMFEKMMADAEALLAAGVVAPGVAPEVTEREPPPPPDLGAVRLLTSSPK
jgi:hypothetical protein